MKTLFDEIGGKTALESLVDNLFKKINSDKALKGLLSEFLSKQNLPLLKSLLARALGASVKIKADVLATLHNELLNKGFSEKDYDLLQDHLTVILKKSAIAPELQEQVLNLLSQSKDYVINTRHIQDTTHHTHTNVSHAHITMSPKTLNIRSEEVLGKKADLDKALEAVKRQQEIMDHILEQAIDGVITINGKNEIVFFNNAAEKILGYTKQDVLGKDARGIVPVERHPAFTNPEAVSLEVLTRGITIPAFRKDGNRIWINLSASRVMSHDAVQYTVFIKDITNEKQLIQNSNGVLSAINSAYAYIEFDPNGNVLDANDVFFSAMGYTREEVKGQHHRIFVDPQYALSQEYFRFWNDLRDGKSNEDQFKRYTKTGKEIWLQAVYAPVLDDEGKVLKVVKIATDITNQKSDSQNMQGVLNAINSAYAFIEFDPKGNILNANQNFLDVAGYQMEEVKGRHHRIFVEGEYANSVNYANFWLDLQAGKNVGGEFKRIAKTGNEVWLQAVYSPVLDDSGNVVKVIKIATDITKVKEETAQLNREIEARMKSVDEACIVSEVDLKGYITYVNDKHCEVSQYSREELIGANQNIVRHPDMPKSLFKDMWAAIGRGQIFRGLVKNRKKDGTPYYVDGVFTPVMGANGKPVKYIGIRFDITEATFEAQRMKGIVDGINTSFAFVEFDTAGNIVNANENTLNLLDYRLDDIKGRHHRNFVSREYSSSVEYVKFWDELQKGVSQGGQFQLYTRTGKEVWFQAIYTPVKDDMGRITGFVKIATDISGQKKVLFDVQQLVSVAGKDGDLRKRLDLSGVDNSLIDLAESVNNLMESISTPILEVSTVISEMAKGDLTKRVMVDAKGDVKVMADGVNSALDNLNKLLGNISHIANLVAASSEQLLAKGEQMKGTTQEVASATQQMAEGTQQQAQQTDESAKLIDLVLQSSNQMGKKAEIINTAAERGQRSASDGLITIRKVVDNMAEIQQSAVVTSNSINILTQRSEEIARTLNVITDIAAQTNLLALNAAIEAARAGDAGRGFAVVAEEIRKLAEDSRKSAVDIEKVIREVQKDINSAGKSIENMEGSVKSGNQASKEAELVFQNIEKTSVETLDLSKEIVEATTSQKSSINDTVKNFEKIVVVSEETASGTEQIASSTKELSQGMNEVTATSSDLADVAAQLQDGVSKFRLNS